MSFSLCRSTGDRRLIALGLIVAGMLVAGVSDGAGARPTGHYPRPVMHDPTRRASGHPPWQIARFEAAIVAETVDTTWLAQVEVLNPDIQLICFIAGTAVVDTLDGWDPADTLAIDPLRRVITVQNDWLLHDVNGNPITTWEGEMLSSWGVNLSAHCPPDANGDRYGTWAGRAIASRFLPDAVGNGSYPGWDGVMMDQMFNGIAWLNDVLDNGPIDLDGDGVAESDDELNTAWRAETVIFLQELRAHARDDFSLTLNGDTVILQDTDGQMMENCLNERTWWEDMYGYAGGNHGGYLQNLALSRSGPDQLCVFHARYTTQTPPLPFAQFARLAAGSSCLGDGYYLLETYDGELYEPVLESEVYDLDLGLPVGELERTVVDGDTLYGRGFTLGYVQVNPNPTPRGGVPARDAVFTFYVPPDSSSVVPGEREAIATWRVPEIEGNAELFTGFEVRYATFPVDAANWYAAIPVRLPTPTADQSWEPGDTLRVEIPDLEPGATYHVSARIAYAGDFASVPAPSTRFHTLSEPGEWEPPIGTGPDGDVFWWDGFESAPPDGDVHALTTYGRELIAGGDFTRMGENDIAHIARWDGERWHPLGSGLDGPVWAMLPYENVLVVAGELGGAGSGDLVKVAAWDGSSWQPLGSSLSGTVRALTTWRGDLVAGGEFSGPDARPTHALARWDGTKWVGIGPDIAQSQQPLRAILQWEADLVAEGRVHVAEGPSPVDAVTAWTGQVWDFLGAPLVGEIHALTQHDGDLVAAGRFLSIDGMAANHIARWDGEAWHPLGPGFDGPVDALLSVGDFLVAGGSFQHVGDEPMRHLARWGGSFWSTIGTGVNGPVLALHEHSGLVHLGGSFERAGDIESPFIARWDLVPDGWTPTLPESPGTLPIPTALRLLPASPNPFSSGAIVRFVLPSDSAVRVVVLDAQGRRVRTLLDGPVVAGTHRLVWDGQTASGARVAPGVYFLRLWSGDLTRTEKLIRVR